VAARSLIQLFREKNPRLLHHKYRVSHVCRQLTVDISTSASCIHLIVLCRSKKICVSCYSITENFVANLWATSWTRATFSKLLRKILGRFLILGQSLTISGKTLTRHNLISLNLLIYDLTTTSRNNVQHDAKIKALVTIIIALLFPNLRLVLW